MTQMKTLLDLSGKVALVTGGSRGLGFQIAQGLGEMGAKVVITARKAHELDEAIGKLREQGIQAGSVQADLAQLENVPALVDRALAAFGSLDILVNNAANNWVAPAEDFPDEAWNKIRTLTLDAPFHLCREVAKRAFIPKRYGKIINIASLAGFKGNAYGAPGGGHIIAYQSGKGGMVNMTRALAVEWGRYNINVNCVAPGTFPTRMAEKYIEELGDAILRQTPLGRLGGDDDLKGAVVFFASDAARHVTGQLLPVDGGFSAE